ncbi:MAG TPA: MFS transporter [Spirochaetales bacterium]|nr:MFS transporter [Spirochaetales bacterium]HRY54558.1 MFS transporter [Spirochaetia bacterium]HRZ65367.1 MFS transporter [Spirochaetia bacterium]
MRRPREALAAGLGFLGRLPREWIVTASRTSIHRFLYQMILPYLSIYTIGLGATGADLGLVNCAGMVVAALASPYVGTMVDRIGPKAIYLLGIALLGLSWLVYGLASSWPAIIAAMILYYLGYRMSGHCCSTVCANSLARADRATAMSCCETLAAGLLGIVGPLLGAFLVSRRGGVGVEAIRPLFFLCLAGTAASFLLVLLCLPGRARGGPGLGRAPFLAETAGVFRHGRKLGRFIVVSVVAQLPQGMIIPFTQPYAATKGADGFVLGAMVTGFALTPLLLGIPAGRLADRIGRKKTIFLVAPLFWASCLLLVLARGPVAMILAGVLQGTFFITGVVTAALQFELVEPGYIGRWLGVLGFFQMLVSAIVAYASGLVWDRLGPQYIFLIPILLDLLVRLPLLAGLPEPRPEAA